MAREPITGTRKKLVPMVPTMLPTVLRPDIAPTVEPEWATSISARRTATARIAVGEPAAGEEAERHAEQENRDQRAPGVDRAAEVGDERPAEHHLEGHRAQAGVEAHREQRAAMQGHLSAPGS